MAAPIAAGGEVTEHHRGLWVLPPNLPGHVPRGSVCVSTCAAARWANAKASQAAISTFPPVRQFIFCFFHPKTRPSLSPLHLLKDGWQKHAALIPSAPSTAGAGRGQPDSSRIPGASLGLLRSSRMDHRVTGAWTTSPPAPCPHAICPWEGCRGSLLWGLSWLF